MIRPLKRASLLAALIGAAVLMAPAPASAGGITMMITPEGGTADLIQHGMQIYSIFEQQKKQKKKRNHAKLDQKGRDNAAAVSQRGVDNYGMIFQRGRGHTATLAQDGSDNALGVFQFGRNTNVDVAQTGQGNVGLVLQGRW